MGPWYDPYRDGPDPALVRRKRVAIKIQSLQSFARTLGRSFDRIGKAADEAAASIKEALS